MHDIAYTGAYVFTATFAEGGVVRDLFTLSALGATTLAEAKRTFRDYVAGTHQYPANKIVVTAKKSSERFA